MPWRGEQRATCKGCGGARQEGELFSARGFHIDCGDQRRTANAVQLHEKSGEFYEHWLRKSFMATNRALLDVQRAEP